MQLTTKQEEGLKITLERYNAGEQYTCIAGYAGTGKSTLVKFIIDAIGLDAEKEVCYCAFTGKAATVLKEKGCPNAITAHKLLYKSVPLPDGTFFFEPVLGLDKNFKIIVVDEVSMLPKEMWDLLLTYNVYVLACGDPFQLPTINPEDDNHVLDNPHIFLDEIMRQALDSEIIRLSLDIREGRPLNLFSGKDVKVIEKASLVTGMLTWADQILCATNNTRISVNQQMRALLGKEGDPKDGDKIICLNNHWDTSGSLDNPLTNGRILTIVNSTTRILRLPEWCVGIGSLPVLVCDLVDDESGEIYHRMYLDKQGLITGIPGLNPKQKFKLSRVSKKYYSGPKNIIDVAFAYAITGHKAQGSEFKNVVVLEERFPFDKIEHARWLYTCITRASDKLVIVKQ
jgi:exodeoxyribonuclease-5